MFASVRTTSSIEDWFDEIEDVRPAVRNAQNKVFFVAAEDSKNYYRNLAKQFLEITNSELLYTFIRDTPWSTSFEDSASDFTLNHRSSSGLTLSRLDKEDLIESLLRRRSAAIQVAETFDTAFARKLEPYLPFANSLTLCDPYAATDILRFQPQPPQFLASLLSQRRCHFELHTSVKNGMSNSQSDGHKMAIEVKRLLGGLPNFDGTYSVFVYESDTKRFHNRRLGIGLRNGGIGFMLDNSLGNLSNHRFKEVTDFQVIDFRNFRTHLQGVRQGLRLLGEAHSDKVNQTAD